MPTGPRPVGGDSEGVAEQAPKKLGALPTTPVLPAPKESSKQLRVFSLDGYFRFRGDWMKQMDLGFSDDPSVGGAPFPNPLACRSMASAGACENSMGAANMRLRLEPIVHLDERSTVHMQFDVLDNLVLGSTHAGTGGGTELPTGLFGDSQRAPQAGVNSSGDSITVKRAWAEIDAPFGLLKFGRQPWHWGMGIFANGGGADPIHGGYNLDADTGDTVDRVSFSAAVPGTKLKAGVAADWSLTGPTASQTGEESGTDRQTWDLDDADDLDQWLFMISHMDSPTRIADMLAEGESVFNYGGFIAYRTQNYDQRNLAFGETPLTDEYVKRDLTSYIPNLWVHYAKGNFDIEAEGVAVLGSFKAPELGNNDTIDIRQFGGVARAHLKLMDDDLTIGLEAGFASGDKHDNAVPGRTHVSGAINLGPGDTKIQQFIFDSNYHVDLILFRELLGSVSNAMYAKPNFKYDLSSKFAVRGAGILSAAHRKQATPGNSDFYGLELDADIGYQNGGFYAGIAYGILLPFAAMDHPGDPNDGSAGFGFGAVDQGAGTAQTIQTRLVLQF
jgi:uncharacterized protein (TIGR04551 family)